MTISDLAPLNKLMFAVVRSKARHALHLQFDIIAYVIEIRAVQTPKCLMYCRHA
jgi:hypothetical protein